MMTMMMIMMMLLLFSNYHRSPYFCSAEEPRAIVVPSTTWLNIELLFRAFVPVKCLLCPIRPQSITEWLGQTTVTCSKGAEQRSDEISIQDSLQPPLRVQSISHRFYDVQIAVSASVSWVNETRGSPQGRERPEMLSQHRTQAC
ncbi:hypothetical protein GGS21DRAFT_394226 [Xylaria nigripes]|nr:hypothetical protein GGS21DRAFT_394226 [Xylaria nigripes]